MYEPTHFKVENSASLHKVMREHPLALLITAGALGPIANAIPFTLEADIGPRGTLRAHCARANPQWRELAEGAAPLVVFQGIERYISPSFYASKKEHGKVVPTWNYVMVQARGRAKVQDNAPFVRAQIEQLTNTHESASAHAWQVGDAPDDFVAAQMRAIVGIEIEINDLRGKFKVSQNRPAQDKASVLAALSAGAGDTDQQMAALLRQAMSGE